MIDELIPEAAPVAEEVAVDFFMIAVQDPAKRTVPLTRYCITACTAMYAKGWGGLQVPFAGIMTLERFVCEYACGTDLCKIAAEDILHNTVFVAAEIHMVV